MLPLIIAGAAANIGGSAIGNLLSQGDKDKAMALQQQALENIKKVNTPEARELALSLEKYTNAGQLAPEMQQTISQSPSLMKDIQVDPRLREAQMDALNELARVSGGQLRAEDLAALNKAKQSVEAQYAGNRQAILQDMASRGVLGGGAELAAQLQNAQSAANRSQSAGLDVAGQASQRALQAIQARAGLGGTMESRQFGQAAEQAAAQDAINRYNAMNSQRVMQENVTARNAAQQYNLGTAQNVANLNTGVANEQARYTAQLPMQIFDANLRKAQAQAQPANNMAQAYMGNAAQTQQMGSGIGQGIGQGISAYGAYQQQQDALKQQNEQQKEYLGTLRDIYGKKSSDEEDLFE